MIISVSGNPTPDCTTAGPVAVAGQHNGKDYWTWEAGGRTWFCWYLLVGGRFVIWRISEGLGVTSDAWTLPNTTPIGEYGDPTGSYTGGPIVAEYVAPGVAHYVTLQVMDGPDAGKLIALRAT
jgi:hypothetical protein